MSQENADEMNEIGSISSGSLEPPPEDLEDNNETGGDDNNNENNPDTEGERLESIPTSPPKRAQATPLPPKTNIDARLTQAQQSYNPDPSRQRSKDVGVLTTKFRQFRVHLNELKPILKSYQEAHKDLHSARTKVSKEVMCSGYQWFFLLLVNFYMSSCFHNGLSIALLYFSNKLVVCRAHRNVDRISIF